MTDRPALLIMQRHLAPLTAFLESEWTVYRFWEGPPIEAAHDIRALVVAGEAPLDKTLIEKLADPIVHLLRNALDHGLEAAEVRHAAQKQSVATITLSAALCLLIRSRASL